MSHWTTDVIGLHEAVDFIENWWVVFLAAPFVVSPPLTYLAVRARRNKASAVAPDPNVQSHPPAHPPAHPPTRSPTPSPTKPRKRRSSSRRRRSFTRRLFVDDGVSSGYRTYLPQLFTGSFIVAAMFSALIFFGMAAVMIIRALIAVNQGSMSLE